MTYRNRMERVSFAVALFKPQDKRKPREQIIYETNRNYLKNKSF